MNFDWHKSHPKVALESAMIASKKFLENGGLRESCKILCDCTREELAQTQFTKYNLSPQFEAIRDEFFLKRLEH